MVSISRRRFLAVMAGGAAVSGFYPLGALGGDLCAVAHPLSPPLAHLRGKCPNCGMGRAMWARTWMLFEYEGLSSEACSFHCLADMERKSGVLPGDIRVALYLEPEKMVPAAGAVFVVGSRAKGTMTATGKAAFSSAETAQGFAARCGGRACGFDEALSIARAGLLQENRMIARRRVKKGKIAMPLDHQDTCPVCDMFPARYPRHRCQIRFGAGQVAHFCSTRCLFEFLQDPAEYGRGEERIAMIWVSDNGSGGWISAYTAYYVVGAATFGPMGWEAFAFDTLDRARRYTRANGGRVVAFGDVTLDKITP